MNRFILFSVFLTLLSAESVWAKSYSCEAEYEYQVSLSLRGAARSLHLSSDREGELMKRVNSAIRYAKLSDGFEFSVAGCTALHAEKVVVRLEKPEDPEAETLKGTLTLFQRGCERRVELICSVVAG